VLMAIALIPDNIKNMETVIAEKSVETHFEASKIGSLIASVDDYLMNANVARDMIELVQNEVGVGN
ncbi:MAG: KEOPS complex subunit Pcc1, partial [Halobacteriota archaeon]